MVEFSSGVMLGAAMAAAFSFMIVTASNPPPDDLHRQAIERGYGLYCPVDGEFAWVGECKETNNDK